MTVVGIDPGLNGAIASSDGVKAQAWVMPCLHNRPDLAKLMEILMELRADLVVIELPETRVGEGASHSLATGVNWGLIVGMLQVLEIPRMEVRSAAWKSRLGLPAGAPKRKVKGEEPETAEQKKGRLGRARKERKAAAIAMAERLFPTVNLMASDRAKNRHDGMAEALLLTEFGLRERGGVSR